MKEIFEKRFYNNYYLYVILGLFYSGIVYVSINVSFWFILGLVIALVTQMFITLAVNVHVTEEIDDIRKFRISEETKKRIDEIRHSNDFKLNILKMFVILKYEDVLSDGDYIKYKNFK